jgi:predicted RNA polymerase sigma factor
MVPMSTSIGDTHRAIEAVWRIESTKIIARVARMISRGLVALSRAERLAEHAVAGSTITAGPYTLQAALRPAMPVLAPRGDRLAPHRLYDTLAGVNASPVVELNRAVAVAMAFGPAAGLEIVDALTSEPSLKNYHLLPSVRGDLLSKLGRSSEARSEFERAASLNRNARERTVLLDRGRSCLT